MAELLKKLSEAYGVSGHEAAVREIIIEEIKDKVDNITVDTMGNVIAYKKGNNSSKRIAVTAHMDEPGFIVSSVTDKGYLKFKSVGTIDPRKVISKKVVVGDSKVKGIIGMKAIHLQTRNERANVVPVSKLFADIGANNKEAALKSVKLGDYITFDTDFAVIGNNVKGKALDRSGVCRALINALDNDYPHDVYACFLAQHEVGARGAKIVAHRVKPDAVLTVSSVDTTDMYGCEENNFGADVGKGAVINYSDKSVIADKNMTDYMVKVANNLKMQIKALKAGISDSGAMQTGASGSKCLSVSIPCRYSNSPVSIMSIKDIDAAAEYVSLFLNKIGEMI